MADSLHVLNYEGNLGIEQVEDLMLSWKGYLSGGVPLILNLARVDSIDLSVIQAILSAKKTAAKLQLTIQVANHVSKPVLESFVLCGMLPHRDHTGRELDSAINNFIRDQG